MLYVHISCFWQQEVKKANYTIGVAGALYYRVPWGAKPEKNVDAYLAS